MSEGSAFGLTIKGLALFAVTLALCALVGVAVAATWVGTWGGGGHWQGCINYKFIDSPGGANPHPARNWTDAEKNVVREAIREWVDLADSGICFSETTGTPDVTFRWEDSDLFGTVIPDGNTAGFAYPQDFKDQPGFPPSGTYPVNEVYFNTSPTAGWYIDPDPATDEPIPGGQWDFLSVAKHEIGHIIGLQHSFGTPESMDTWSTGQRQRLTDSDRQAAKALYPLPTPQPTSVGGVAELPDLSKASAEEAGVPAGSSTSSAAEYAALAGGVAAAAVALGAGGWFARRRWIK